ncbi:carboxypeptidase-like regulatory domain-containing protein [bacterium]|nr:carboxypeptidase-like regulatory domain-containing protein [bacterium]
MMKNKIFYPIALSGALLAFTALVPFAAEPLGEIAGTVTDAGGAPVKGARVAVLDKVAVTGADGSYTLKGLPPEHEITIRTYRSAPPPKGAEPAPKSFLYRDTTAATPFLLAAAMLHEGRGKEKPEVLARADFRVFSLEGGKAEIDFSLQPVEDSVALCQGCHSPDEAYPHRLIPDPKLPAPAVDEDLYRSHRPRDVHPVGIDMRKRLQVPKTKGKTPAAPMLFGERLFLAGDRTIVCLTCHTGHLPTTFGRNVVMQFKEGSQLCQECHD